MQRQGYESWLQLVDAYVSRLATGFNHDDLDDMPWWRWHQEGVRPQTAAARAIKWSRAGYRPDFAD